MQLSQQEVEQLKSAGFSDHDLEGARIIKEKAEVTDGVDWLELFEKLIENGPKIVAFLKLFRGLFGKT